MSAVKHVIFGNIADKYNWIRREIMKKSYLEPKIFLSKFSGRDVVCASDNFGAWKDEWTTDATFVEWEE